MESAPETFRSSPGARVIALLGYAGLAPFLWVRTRNRGDFLRSHGEAALTLSALLIALFGVFIVCFVLDSLAIVYMRYAFEHWPVERILADIVGVLFVLWVAGWAASLYQAVRGRTWNVPYVARLAGCFRKRGAYLPLAALCIVLYGLLGIVIAVAGHASDMTRPHGKPAQAYMLYDDMGYVPRRIFALGFYRAARAADRRWGPGSAVVEPLTKANLRDALQNGRYVFVASHGVRKGFFTRHETFSPEEVAAMGHGPQLQYVYLSACDVGYRASEWQTAFGSAKVVTFNRLSATLEHAAYLWLRAPGIIDGLN